MVFHIQRTTHTSVQKQTFAEQHSAHRLMVVLILGATQVSKGESGPQEVSFAIKVRFLMLKQFGSSACFQTPGDPGGVGRFDI